MNFNQYYAKNQLFAVKAQYAVVTVTASVGLFICSWASDALLQQVCIYLLAKLLCILIIQQISKLYEPVFVAVWILVRNS